MPNFLLTSPDALVDRSTGNLYSELQSALDYFLSKDEQSAVVVVSKDASKLENIPDRFNPLELPYKLRGSAKVKSVSINGSFLRQEFVS